MEPSAEAGHEHGVFVTTRWSVVLSAGGAGSPAAEDALAKLCETYWRPVYCCVRRKGYSPDDAKDLTQALFAKFLEKDGFAHADRSRGRFRTFLLRSMENLLHNEHDRGEAVKRGRGFTFIPLDVPSTEDGYAIDPPDRRSPEQVYDRRWAVTVLETVMRRLREEFLQRGKEELFKALEPGLWRDDDRATGEAVGQPFGMSAAAIRTQVCRLRARYRELLREEIAQTVSSPAEVDAELAHLRQALVD